MTLPLYPQNYVNSEQVEVVTCQSGSDSVAHGGDLSAYYPIVTEGNGTVVSDREDTVNGLDQVVKLTANASNNINCTFDFSESVDMSNDLDNICILINLEDNTATGNLIFWLTNNGYTGQVSRTIAFGSLYKGWQSYILKASDFGAPTGSGFDWTAINSLKIRITSAEAETRFVKVAGVHANSRNCPVLLWHFDDGFGSCYNLGLPILSAANMKASVMLTTPGSVSLPKFPGDGTNDDYMTVAQMEELYTTYGWDVGNHWHNHDDQMEDLTTQELIDGTKQTHDAIVGYGWTRGVDGMVYMNLEAGSSPSKRVKNAVASAGINYAFSSQGGYFIPSVFNDYQRIGRHGVVSTSTAEQFTADIDRLVETGGTQVIQIHELVDGSPTRPTQTTITVMQAIVDYVAPYMLDGSLRVMTNSAWKRYSERPPMLGD